MKIGRIVWASLVVLYPLMVFLGLKTGFWDARQLSILLLLIAATKFFLRSQKSPLDFYLAALPALLALPAFLLNQEIWVLIYPALVSALLFIIFAHSLYRPPSMIEMLAHLHDPDLTPEAVSYTRKVTQVWCLFFLLNGSFALLTVFFASHEIWALYNGLIAYGLIGLMFSGEWLIRKIYLSRRGTK